jgi:hypothetical protein
MILKTAKILSAIVARVVVSAAVYLFVAVFVLPPALRMIQRRLVSSSPEFRQDTVRIDLPYGRCLLKPDQGEVVRCMAVEAKMHLSRLSR